MVQQVFPFQITFGLEVDDIENMAPPPRNDSALEWSVVSYSKSAGASSLSDDDSSSGDEKSNEGNFQHRADSEQNGDDIFGGLFFDLGRGKQLPEDDEEEDEVVFGDDQSRKKTERLVREASLIFCGLHSIPNQWI